METVFKLIMCHLIGDYVLQQDFIAKSKGENVYHLFVHCFLYTLPFYFIFGYKWQLFVILFTHIIIDTLKAKWQKIDYFADQVLHYLILFVIITLKEN